MNVVCFRCGKKIEESGNWTCVGCGLKLLEIDKISSLFALNFDSVNNELAKRRQAELLRRESPSEPPEPLRMERSSGSPGIKRLLRKGAIKLTDFGDGLSIEALCDSGWEALHAGLACDGVPDIALEPQSKAWLQLKRLDLAEDDFARLTVMFLNLRELSLVKCRFCDAKTLEIIDSDEGRIVKILFSLSNLPHLKKLSLDNSQIKYISGVSSMLGLTDLAASGNKIKSISSLSCLSSLESLDLSYNLISNASHLSTLVNLKRLNLSGNLITRINSLSSLKNLHYLDLSHLGVKDFSSLSCLRNLSGLRLDEVKVREIFLSPNSFPKNEWILTRDLSLKDLHVSEACNLNEAQRNTLVRKLPGINIHFEQR
jgi:hypothetical protein